MMMTGVATQRITSMLLAALLWCSKETLAFSSAGRTVHGVTPFISSFRDESIRQGHHHDVFQRQYTMQCSSRAELVKLSAESGKGDVERPDPSILLAAKSDSQQQIGVAAIGAGLLVGTYLFNSFLVWLQTITGGWTSSVVDLTVPVPMGLLFLFVGATHFFFKDEYAAIVPPKGAWGGLWNVPTPGADRLKLTDEEYHVLWSGVAEMGGGALLILGGLHVIPVQIPALLMFLLTVAVTPANIYMFTHDAPLAFAPQLKYPDDHIARGVLQIILLSLFWYLATHP